MFGLRKILSSLFLAIVFLALAALAAFFYNSDEEDQAAFRESPFWQKAGSAVSALVALSKGAADTNMDKNTGLGKTMVEAAGKVEWDKVAGTVTGDKKPNESGEGYFSGLKSSLSKEWEAGREAATQEAQEIDTDALDDFPQRFSYQKKEGGAEISYRTPRGREYRLPIPLPFLGN